MCVIIELPKGVNVPFPALQNAVWNNPHGYGLVIRKSATDLKVVKDMPEGGTDPKDIDALLRKYDKFHRFIHLRWKTEGSISLDNQHPFVVYDDGTTQVYFMHNGTLHDYKPTGTDDRSDSRIFAEDFLVPLLAELKGCYSSDLAKKIIGKFWGVQTSSKGLLVSNKFIPIYLNYQEWKDVKITDGVGEVTFKASNNSYFDKLERGYEFDRREEERKATQVVLPFRGSAGSPEWPLVPLKDINLKSLQILTDDLKDVLTDSDLHSDIGTAALANISAVEFDLLHEKHPDVFVPLIMHLTHSYHTLLSKKMMLDDKLDRASKYISELKQRVN